MCGCFCIKTLREVNHDIRIFAGVFIVQPQGVSDDEGQEVKSGSGLESLHENETGKNDLKEVL